MRIIIYALIIIFAVNAIAQAEVRSQAKISEPSQLKTSKSRSKFLLGYASEARIEQNFEKENHLQSLSNMSLSFQFSEKMLSLERSEFSEMSGNASLNVKRKFQDYLVWAEYIPEMNSLTSLFVGLGIGSYQDTIETQLYNQSAKSSADWRLLGGCNFGIQLHYSWVWTSLELRALVGDELERQPKLGGLAKMGVQF